MIDYPTDINPLAVLTVTCMVELLSSGISIVQSAFLAVVLIFVDLLIHHEPLSWNKLAGVGICIVGLVFINLK